MAGMFTNLFGKRGDSVLGIDIGSSSIKVVQLRKKGGRALLETYGALALGPYGATEIGRSVRLPTEKIIEALNDIIREAKITTKNCGLAIPFQSSLMSVMEMPRVSTKELSQMVPIEARKYIPVPISEVTLDWSVIPQNEYRFDEPNKRNYNRTSKTEVLVVAIHNDVINEYQSIIKGSELEANFFEIEIFSTMRSVLEQEIAPLAIFDMGAASTKLYIVERGIVKSSHTVNRGSQDITLALSHSMNIPVAQAETIKRGLGPAGSFETKEVAEVITLTMDFIFSEANRVLLSYQKKYQKTISKIVLVGGGAALRGFNRLAQKNFKTEAVLGDAFSKIETPAFLEDILRNTGPEFSVAAGVALRRLQEVG